VYAVRSAFARSRFFENLDPGWKAAIIAHYGVFAMPEYVATFGEARMGRFGRAAAWRNMALFGTLDEIRHGQLQFSFPHALLNKEPRLEWMPLAYRGMDGVLELFGQAARQVEPQAVLAKVRAAHHAFLARCSLNAVAA